MYSSAPAVQLRITGTDSRSVLDAVSAHFATVSGAAVPAGRHGSGLVSLQRILLVLELGRTRAEQGEGFAMALEHPGLHLSPATQLQLVHRIQGLSTQTFITTHSPIVAALADPTEVLVLQNQEGTLTARPFLAKPLIEDSPNSKRKCYQQNRVEVLSAMMHPALLIAEGKADFHLLCTILRPLLLSEGWAADMQRPFGLEVGMLPTEDAKVVETYQLLHQVHPRACCLVDGDHDRLRYIAGLRALPVLPPSVIRWEDGAMVEDVIGWISAADPAGCVPLVAEIGGSIPATVADVADRLKFRKMDIVAYEIVAGAMVNIAACRHRAVAVFNAIACACAGVESDLFALDAGGKWVFQP